MRKCAFFLTLGVIICACKTPDRRTGDESILPEAEYTRYATGFQVERSENYIHISVYNPWQNSSDVVFEYLLAESASTIPDSLAHLKFIQTPVTRIVALSTTQVAMIDALGAASTLKGISGTGYIHSEAIRKAIVAGDIVEVGYDQGLNLEAIVAIDPDVLFLYGVEGSVQSIAQKLEELRIPVVYCGEYLEPHPLGKSEWIRFFGQFLDMEQEADALFGNIEHRYLALRESAKSVEHRPRILTGLPWNDTWYMAGGASYAARLIQDAGGEFLWKENPSTQAIPMDLESVFVKAIHADIWINPGAAASLSDLRQFDERFLELPMMIQGQVYNNNLRLTSTGGNDYWESGTVRPDLILADLMKAFHPGLMDDHSFYYYRKLK